MKAAVSAPFDVHKHMSARPRFPGWQNTDAGFRISVTFATQWKRGEFTSTGEQVSLKWSKSQGWLWKRLQGVTDGLMWSIQVFPGITHTHTYSRVMPLNGDIAGTLINTHTLMERMQIHSHTQPILLSRKLHISPCHNRQLYIHTPNHSHIHLSYTHTHTWLIWVLRDLAKVTGPRVNSCSSWTSSALFWFYSHPRTCSDADAAKADIFLKRTASDSGLIMKWRGAEGAFLASTPWLPSHSVAFHMLLSRLPSCIIICLFAQTHLLKTKLEKIRRKLDSCNSAAEISASKILSVHVSGIVFFWYVLFWKDVNRTNPVVIFRNTCRMIMCRTKSAGQL